MLLYLQIWISNQRMKNLDFKLHLQTKNLFKKFIKNQIQFKISKFMVDQLSMLNDYMADQWLRACWSISLAMWYIKLSWNCSLSNLYPSEKSPLRSRKTTLTSWQEEMLIISHNKKKYLDFSQYREELLVINLVSKYFEF